MSLLAATIPFALFAAGIWLMGTRGWINTLKEIIFGKQTHSWCSQDRAALSFSQYHATALAELAHMRASYAKLGRAHKRIGYELGYPNKLQMLAEAISANAKVTEAIANSARAPPGQPATGDLSRVRETLRHFVRDWSNEGQRERKIIFSPILDVLRQVPESRRGDTKVLVPGSGLGRLAWEISQLGFDSTANELSYYMIHALNFLLSPSTTRSPNQHTIQPYASWFSHQRTNDNLFRSVSFPDAVPRLNSHFHLTEDDFLHLRPPPRNVDTNTAPGYDYIVTLFFIDTSPNIISTLTHIHALLRPGGTWINLGPLLWPASSDTRLELSLDEVHHLARSIGFRMEGDPERDETITAETRVRRRRTVECEYTADGKAMMRWLYQAEFWVATKV